MFVVRSVRFQGITSKAYGVTVKKGFGVLMDKNMIETEGERVRAENIILATGSTPVRPPITGMDGKNILTSDELLALEEAPEKLIIIGGGVIGIEFATLFSALGKNVTVRAGVATRCLNGE